MTVTRRRFVGGLTTALGALTLSPGGRAWPQAAQAPSRRQATAEELQRDGIRL